MPELAKTSPQDDTLVKARRKQIFLAACRVLARKSFHEATVKELALEAGLAAGSIYLYLQSKDDILPLIAESMVAEVIESLPTIRQQTAGDPRRELVEMMRTMVDVIDRYREALNVLQHQVCYHARRPEYRNALAKIVDPYLSAIGDVLERGRQAGVIHFNDRRSVVEAIHMMCAGWATGGNFLRGTDKETYWREIAAIVEGRLVAPAQTNSNGRAR